MSAGWFFTTPDQSSQGSMSPALNTAEATLLVAGVAVALAAGFSLNVLLLLHVALEVVAQLLDRAELVGQRPPAQAAPAVRILDQHAVAQEVAAVRIELDFEQRAVGEQHLLR